MTTLTDRLNSGTTVDATISYDTVDAAFIKANSSFDSSNTKLSLSGGTITGNLIVSGNTNANVFTSNVFTSNTVTSNVITANTVTANLIGNATTVTNGVYTTDFTGVSNQSVTTNGYQKFPGGLILQWCVGGNVASESDITVTFPIAFPTACLNIMLGTQMPNGDRDGMFQLRSFDRFGCVARFNQFSGAGGTGQPLVWAIGY